MQGWKVAGIFIGVIGAAAIIYQLNKGTLFQSATGGFTSAINTAFSGGSTSSTIGSSKTSVPRSSGRTNKTSGTTNYGGKTIV